MTERVINSVKSQAEAVPAAGCNIVSGLQPKILNVGIVTDCIPAVAAETIIAVRIVGQIVQLKTLHIPGGAGNPVIPAHQKPGIVKPVLLI